jgi:hypothetical protein
MTQGKKERKVTSPAMKNCSGQGWAVYEYDGVSHVIPLEDLEPHQHTIDCHCNPMRHPETTRRLVIHVSFDNREMREDKPIGFRYYSDQEIRACLTGLVERGVDIDALPGDKTVQYLFDLFESVRPN